MPVGWIGGFQEVRERMKEFDASSVSFKRKSSHPGAQLAPNLLLQENGESEKAVSGNRLICIGVDTQRQSSNGGGGSTSLVLTIRGGSASAFSIQPLVQEELRPAPCRPSFHTGLPWKV